MLTKIKKLQNRFQNVNFHIQYKYPVLLVKLSKKQNKKILTSFKHILISCVWAMCSTKNCFRESPQKIQPQNAFHASYVYVQKEPMYTNKLNIKSNNTHKNPLTKYHMI